MSVLQSDFSVTWEHSDRQGAFIVRRRKRCRTLPKGSHTLEQVCRRQGPPSSYSVTFGDSFLPYHPVLLRDLCLLYCKVFQNPKRASLKAFDSDKGPSQQHKTYSRLSSTRRRRLLEDLTHHCLTTKDETFFFLRKPPIAALKREDQTKASSLSLSCFLALSQADGD